MGETLGPDANLSESIDYSSEPMALEDRLEHFVSWLAAQEDTHLVHTEGRGLVGLDYDQIQAVIQRYVNE